MRDKLLIVWLILIVTLGFGAITQSQLPSVHNIVGQAPLLKDSADSSNVKPRSISGGDLTDPFRYTGTYFYAVNGVYSGSVAAAQAVITGPVSGTTGVYSGTVQAAGVENTAKSYKFTACTSWSDTTHWQGPRLFIFAAGDTLYIYTAAHEIKKFPGL
jgi:hypothetical protein